MVIEGKRVSNVDFTNNEYIFKVPNSETLNFQGNGKVNFKIQISLDGKENWSDTSLINLKDFSIVKNVEDNCIYTAATECIAYIKIIATELNDNSEIIIKGVNHIWT